MLNDSKVKYAQVGVNVVNDNVVVNDNMVTAAM